MSIENLTKVPKDGWYWPDRKPVLPVDKKRKRKKTPGDSDKILTNPNASAGVTKPFSLK